MLIYFQSFNTDRKEDNDIEIITKNIYFDAIDNFKMRKLYQSMLQKDPHKRRKALNYAKIIELIDYDGLKLN